MGIKEKEANREMFSTSKSAKVLSEPIVESTQPTLKQEAHTAAEVFERLETVAEPEVPVNPHSITQAPVKKKGRPVVNRETKKRYTLTFLPSVYEKASEKASEQGKSLSEVVGDFLSGYIQSNKDKLN